MAPAEASEEAAYPGCFIGSTTEADNSCRLENLVVMFEVTRELSPDKL